MRAAHRAPRGRPSSGPAGRSPSERAAALQGRNRLQSTLLLLCMLALVGGLAHLLLGPLWIPWLVGLGAAALVGVPQLPPEVLMRLLGGRELHSSGAPRLHALLCELALRAELPRVPRLYWLPRGLLNAFAVGTPRRSAIAVTEGLLRTLSPREVAGVLAHEIAHVRAGDMRAMLIAEVFARITATFGSVGLLLAMLNVPLWMLGEAGVSWGAVLLLLASPSLSVMLQLALSRARERSADLEAVRLTGDPRGLASALQKIGTLQEGLLETLVFRHRHGPESPWLRSHPATEERVATLLELEAEPERAPLPEPELLGFVQQLPVRRRRSHYVR